MVWRGALRSGHADGLGRWAGEKILKSTDAGATWVSQRDANHSFNLIDVFFADLNNGWAAGGVELHTTDGGASWVQQNTGVFASVSVYAVSSTTAWIGGLQDLGRTTDGGATWTIERPSDTDWFCLTFLDANNGWAGGQDQTIDDVPGTIWKRTGSALMPIEGSDSPDVIESALRPSPPSAAPVTTKYDQ